MTSEVTLIYNHNLQYDLGFYIKQKVFGYKSQNICRQISSSYKDGVFFSVEQMKGSDKHEVSIHL